MTLAVAKGLHSVLLGDATLANMTVIPATVFTNADVRLRVWFNDGTHGSQQLSPDQRIAAVGCAMMAGTVQDGAITSGKIADGAVGSGQIEAGAVGSAQLASGAVQASNIAAGAVGGTQLSSGAAASNLNAGGQSAVAGGGIVLSEGANAELVAAGYVKIGETTLALDNERWQQRASGNPPSARASHTAVWTGSEMIVWGGDGTGRYLADTWSYRPGYRVMHLYRRP